MPAVSETIVREYFELHGFLVRQHRKYVSPTRGQEGAIDFFVLNPHPQTRPGAAPFILTRADLPYLDRAIVVVKGWHTETFSPARLVNAPAILRFVEPRVFQQAVRVFGRDGTPLKILVVPTLPHTERARQETITFLQSKGVDAVLSFRTVLAELIDKIEPNRNYQKSDLLQMIRILKNYEFFREPQLELFKPRRRAGREASAARKLPD